MRPDRRSPRVDKDLDYSRQAPSDIVPGSRGRWQWTKKSVHRGYRRGESSTLAKSAALADPDAANEAEERVARIRRKRTTYTRAESLADRVTARLFRRFLDLVDTYSTGPYRRATQRVRTDRALAALVRDRPTTRPASVWAERVALCVDALLPDPVRKSTNRQHLVPAPARLLARRRAWFAAFLADQPSWEPRLVRWITDHTR